MITVFLTSTLKSDPLTAAENDERLEKCGRQFLPTGEDIKPDENDSMPAADSKSLWLFKVMNKNASDYTRDTYMSLGSVISKRHLITSSQTIIVQPDKHIQVLSWALDGTYVDTTCDERGNLAVPKKMAKNLNIMGVWCAKTEGKCKHKVFKVKKAWILNLCGRLRSYHKEASPLLLELKADDEEIKYPCLANDSTVLSGGEPLTAYELRYSKRKYTNPSFRDRQLTFDFYTHDKLFVVLNGKRPAYGDRGGPLIRNESGTARLVAINGDGPLPGDKAYFFDLKDMQEDLKKFAGIHNEFKGQPPSSTSTALPSTSTSSPTVPLPPVPSSPQPTASVVTKQTESARKEPDTATEVPRKEENDEDEESDDLFVSEEFLNESAANSLLILFVLSLLIQ
ncbi:unnamed protein product [Caenorhabditis sp. 36 PRJEB53466]|nr:unnamed protein product [Caenorhabditis sp. 36 PRJEB53466]